MLIQVAQDPPKAVARAAMLFLAVALFSTLLMVVRLFLGYGFSPDLNILGFLVFGGLLAQKPGWRTFGIILASLTLAAVAIIGVLILFNIGAPGRHTHSSWEIFELVVLPLKFAAALCELYLLLRDDVTGWFEVVRLPPSAMPPMRPKASVTKVPKAPQGTPTGGSSEP